MGCPRCELVEEKKSNPIGGSQWNTWGGNCENFIRPQTRRRAGTIYSKRSIAERVGMTNKKTVKTTTIKCEDGGKRRAGIIAQWHPIQHYAQEKRDGICGNVIQSSA